MQILLIANLTEAWKLLAPTDHEISAYRDQTSVDNKFQNDFSAIYNLPKRNVALYWGSLFFFYSRITCVILLMVYYKNIT